MYNEEGDSLNMTKVTLIATDAQDAINKALEKETDKEYYITEVTLITILD